ncbi:MAG: hypothetical protein ABIY37_04315 [Devosia sp.]
MIRRRLLALAAASQKIGFVYLQGREVLDWGLARKASHSVDAAFDQAAAWIDFYKPSRVVTEAIDGGTRKGKHTISLIHAFGAAARDRRVRLIAVPRRRQHLNKYVEAGALAAKHPPLGPWLPNARRSWESEPHKIIIFEALSLAEGYMTGEGEPVKG